MPVTGGRPTRHAVLWAAWGCLCVSGWGSGGRGAQAAASWAQTAFEPGQAALGQIDNLLYWQPLKAGQRHRAQTRVCSGNGEACGVAAFLADNDRLQPRSGWPPAPHP